MIKRKYHISTIVFTRNTTYNLFTFKNLDMVNKIYEI